MNCNRLLFVYVHQKGYILWEDKLRHVEFEVIAEYTNENILEAFWNVGLELGEILGFDFFFLIYMGIDWNQKVACDPKGIELLKKKLK